MRLYLLPLSTRRTLIYAQRLNITTAPSDTGILNKALAKSQSLWASWEAKEKGWQRKVVDYGNYAMRRIPFEEWGLKSIPPLSTRLKDEELKGKDKVELVFPGSVLPTTKAEGIARRLATEREGLHKKSMIWCVVGMPITIPFALVPVIPNLPFFYLVFRAWSHWKAIAGGKHVRWLSEQNLLQLAPSKTLDTLYKTSGKEPLVLQEDQEEHKEKMLLTQQQVRDFATTLEIPALTLELERAIWQVEESINTKDEEAKLKAEGSKETTSEKDNKED